MIGLFVAMLCVPAGAADIRKLPVSIVQVLPFAGGDNVRIEVVIKSQAARPIPGIQLRAAITPWPKGKLLWKGTLGTANLGADEQKTVTKHVTGLKPALWSPTSPRLYDLTVKAVSKGNTLAVTTIRFGFRRIETRGGRIYLNGKPIFLRGNAINPPGRGVPDDVGHSRSFIEAYIRDLKSRNVNLVRVGSEKWLDVCDELGMMVFTGRYGKPPGGTKSAPPTDFDKSIREYKQEILEEFQKHPSVIISILTNEMTRRGEEGKAYDAYLERAWRVLKAWDPNRLYIGNAGFGRGHGGELYDCHPYLGWYGGSFLDFYRFREPYREPPARTLQPVTLSECVGAYTNDKGYFNIKKKLLAPALAWAGHASDLNGEALRYQAFLTGQFVECIRRLRGISPSLAGVMPFTHIFRWDDVRSFQEVKPNPSADQMRISYQPILLSWENWTPHAYAGAPVHVTAHIVNDSDDARDLQGAKLVYELLDESGETILTDEKMLPTVPYYATHAVPIILALPQTMPTGDYKISGRIIEGKRTISSNSTPIFVASADWPAAGRRQERDIMLYDPAGKTGTAFTRLGIRFENAADLTALDPADSLVIGEDAWDDRLAEKGEALREFIQQGGRLLLLRQGKDFKMDWLGTVVSAAQGQGLWINPERFNHPILEGIGRERLRYWSDYSGWNPAKEGLPKVYPVTSRFKLEEPIDFAHVAVLADSGRCLTDIRLCEIFDGKGSAVLCGFDLVNRSGLDPIADRLLCNLVLYTASKSDHQRHPLIDSPIRWGDYASERGVVTGPFHGLLENQENIERYPQTGRRPFGSYIFGGGTGTYIVDPNPDSATGSGVFCAAIPAGRKTIVTCVANPTQEIAGLKIEINGEKSGNDETIPAGKTVTVRNPLPEDVSDVCVRYTGQKELVLLETSFE